MVDDVLSSFLVRITYQQDEKSRKDFDQALRQVGSRAEEFGAKIGALPAIVSDATKRISSSLTELYYSAQKNGATARELDALRYAAKQSGEGADKAEASFNAFSQRIRDFATGAARQYKSLFGVDIDPNHTFDAFLKIREKIEELRNRGGSENLSRANMLARTFGIDEDALISGRLGEFNKRIREQLKRNSEIDAEKAVALTRAYNALAAALDAVARKADSALFDKFGAVLDRLTRWLDEDSDKIVNFFTELVAQIGQVFVDLSKLKPAFVLLWDALKEVGGWLQKIIGQPDGSGLAGVRHLLEVISGVVMVRFAASMAAGFIAAFAPLTALLLALGALGIISLGAYTAGDTIRGWLGGGVGGGGGGFEPSEGTAAGGHGATRRGRFGHGGAPGSARRGGGVPPSGPSGSVYSMIDKAAAGDHRVADAMKAIFEGESEHAKGVFDVGDRGASYGPFQMDVEGGRLGAQFQEATHIDPRKPENQQAVANWVAKYLKGKYAADPNYNPGGTWFGYPHGLERIQRGQVHPNDTIFNVPAKPDVANPLANIQKPSTDFHKAIETIRAAKPSTPWQQSTNEIHDHRAVTNDVNIHVAGGFPVEKTERPLSRPRNADLIRNTASYAA